jgi:hypothetical protein
MRVEGCWITVMSSLEMVLTMCVSEFIVGLNSTFVGVQGLGFGV